MKNVILYFCLFMITVSSVFGQNKYKTIRNSDIIEYRKKDGLPSSNLTSMIQAKDGYIWLSGAEGTFRFDGYEFAEVGEEFGIPDMQAVFYDTLNNIIYFASPEKFASFDGEKFNTYTSDSGYEITENPGQVISFVKGDSEGRIWIGSYTPYTDKSFNGSLLYFKDEKFVKFDSLSFPLHNAQNFIDTPFGDLIFSSYGKDTQNGDEAYIALFKNGKFNRIDEKFGVNYINARIDDHYSSYIDHKGNTWISFLGKRAFVNDQKSKGTGIIMYDGDEFHSFPGLNKYIDPNSFVGFVFCDNDDQKIYATLGSVMPLKFSPDNKLIFEFENNSWVHASISQEIYESEKNRNNEVLDFSYNFIRFIKKSNQIPLSIVYRTTGVAQSSVVSSQYFSKDFDRWYKYDSFKGIPVLDLPNGVLISTTKGIGILTPGNSKILQRKDGLLLLEASIPNVYTDRKGMVWITYSYSRIPNYANLNKVGLNVWDGEKLNILTVKDGLASDVTFLPYQDKNMRIWVPTDKGITLIREFRNSENEWIFKLKNLVTTSGKPYNVSYIAASENDDIVVFENYVRPAYASIPKADFFLGKIVDEKVEEIESPFNLELQKKLYHNYSARFDSKNRLWLEGHFAENMEELGSALTVLKIYDGSKWFDPPAEWQVPNEPIHFVGELENGAYYLTNGHFYNFNGEKFFDLTDSVDQFADFSILKAASLSGTQTEIQSGNHLYIRLRNNGLVIFDGKNLDFLTPKNSSVPTDIHNPVIDYKGNLFFGSRSGAVQITGKDVKLYYDDDNITDGGPACSVLDMNDNLIRFYSGVGLLVEKNKDKSAELKFSSVTINKTPHFHHFPSELSHSENSLLFNYAVLNFNKASETLYEHILEGYDKEWSRETNRPFSEYQNLPSGSFNFKVRAITSDGDTSNEISFAFKIYPPWWKTWWAYFTYFILSLLLLYSIRKFELNRQKKNEKIKESQYRAETAELQAKAAESQSRVIQAENERKTKELEEARELQLSMLPKVLPQLSKLEIAAYMKTATEVGGDYYDFAISEDGTLNVGVGDATGHGMQAGTIVTLLKGLFTSEVSKKELLTFLRDTSNAMKGIELGRLMMAFSLLKIKENHIQFSSAGMPPMYIYRNEAKIVEEIDMQGMPLGAIKDFKYNLYETELSSGDCILLLSDGYPELENMKNEQIGYERLKIQFADVAEKHPDEIIQYLKNKGSEWVDDNDPDDDVTFVVLKVK